MEFRIADLRLLIAELRKTAVNNRKSSFEDDRNRDWLSTGNVEELKNAPQFQTHPSCSGRLEIGHTVGHNLEIETLVPFLVGFLF